MADITQILSNSDTNAVIEQLKNGRTTAAPVVDEIKQQLDVSRHDVNDNTKRPDKLIKVDAEENKDRTPTPENQTPYSETNLKSVPVARVALAIQKLIVKRAVSFTFGNDITLSCEPQSDKENEVLRAVKRVLFDNKSKTLNRKVAREIFSFTETAELWYPVENQNENYGFNSAYKLRSAVFSVANGDKLYPFFDQTGNMLAFSREYTITIEKKQHTYFETYTDTEIYRWSRDDGRWLLVENYPRPNILKKIPVVYGSQPQTEWADVQALIDRLETLLSNFADTNDYHASPKIVVKGEIKGFAKKGESGAVLELDGDTADAKYLEWSQAPESVRLEIETLLRMIYTITQTPDISFDTIKGIGAVSGIALKLLFMDAHLKVQEKMELFSDYLQRRISIIQAFLAVMNTNDSAFAKACKSLMIEPEVNPYIIDDDMSKVQVLTEANGGKALISQRNSIQQLGWTNDAESEYELIQAEEARANERSITEPTM